jgi:hypothetical protein
VLKCRWVLNIKVKLHQHSKYHKSIVLCVMFIVKIITIYNMSGSVVSDIQTRADANVGNGL